MRVIVCGGRNFGLVPKERAWIVDWLVEILPKTSTIITGGAPGVDTIANTFATDFGFFWEEFPAQWSTLGPKAGPIRNQKMLDSGIDLVIAFPGGRGTKDMIRRAKKAGVKVIECSYP